MPRYGKDSFGKPLLILFNQYNFNSVKVEHLSDPVGAVIDIYRQAGNISLTRVSLIQSLLAHGIITHAQYMNFMYMKSVLAQCNGEGKGEIEGVEMIFVVYNINKYVCVCVF